MFRESKIKFQDWKNIKEEESGFYDVQSGKRVLFWDDLSPEGKKQNTSEWRETKGLAVTEHILSKARAGRGKAIETYIKQEGDLETLRGALKQLSSTSRKLNLRMGDGYMKIKARRVHLHRAYFEGSNICWSEFSDSEIKDSSFKGTKMRGSNFHNVVFLGKNDFSVSDLELVDFSGAKNIKSIDFSGSNLNSVNFQGSDLRGVDLSLAKEAKGIFLDANTKVDDRTKHPRYREVESAISEAENAIRSKRIDGGEANRLIGMLDRLIGIDNVEFFYGKKINKITSRIKNQSSTVQRIVQRAIRRFK